MVRLFVRHQVADYEGWRRGYDDFDAARRGMGVRGDAVFQKLDDPNDVTAWHDFDTLDDAQAFLSSPELKVAMEAAGVTGEPQIWLASEA
jgi:hypothetical protein